VGVGALVGAGGELATAVLDAADIVLPGELARSSGLATIGLAGGGGGAQAARVRARASPCSSFIARILGSVRCSTASLPFNDGQGGNLTAPREMLVRQRPLARLRVEPRLPA
jgi:hypothetical protein